MKVTATNHRPVLHLRTKHRKQRLGEGISGHGGYLYQSVSQTDPSYTEPYRKLMFLSLMYGRELFEGLSIDARFEPYYDFFNTRFEYSYSFYMVYRPEFRLVKVKKDWVKN